ncbi:MAG TPA: NAD(P)H-hydrate dehydratase, partial [Myxococcota bacterium]
VVVVVIAARDAVKGDALSSLQALEQTARALRLEDIVIFATDDHADVGAFVDDADLVVDAVFGIGLSRPVLAGAGAAAIAAINASRAVVVSVDVPSGLFADGQKPARDAHVVNADITVTFGEKPAHVIEHGAAHCGAVIDVDIGFARAVDEGLDVFVVDHVRLPAPDPRGFKGRFGHIGVVVGSEGTSGAALLAAHAAQRAGAGLVTLLGSRTMPRPPELMARDLDDVDGDDDVFGGLDAVVVGPGLSAKAASSLRTRLRAARQRGLRVVADAGALGALNKGDADIWTPHPGEAARVLGTSSADVEADRLAAARAVQQQLGGVVILKGACPIVVDDTTLAIVRGHSAALAVAGAGDVLAGVVGAGLGGAFDDGNTDGDVVDVATAATWLHQQAGRGEARGLLAGELADRVRSAVRAAIEPGSGDD